MNKYFGRFNGTGAAVYLGLGGIPETFKLLAAEDGDLASIFWSRQLSAAAETARGILAVTGTTYQSLDPRTVADTGVVPYYGGDVMTSTNQTSVGYGEGVYLMLDDADYKADLTYGVEAPITKWTLGSSTNRTGNFDANLLRCVAGLGGAGAGYIGEGSEIVIREAVTKTVKTVFIQSGGNTSAAAGSAANSVTLSEAVASGDVLSIGGAFTFIPVPLGQVAPAGVKIEYYTYINVNDEMQVVEWEM